MTKYTFFQPGDMLAGFPAPTIDESAIDLKSITNQSARIGYYNYGQEPNLPIGAFDFKYTGWGFKKDSNPILNSMSGEFEGDKVFSIEQFSVQVNDIQDTNLGFYSSAGYQKLFAGNDEIYGSDGADKLAGGSGDDLLKGGIGNDHLYGDNGLDTIYGEDGGDFIIGGDGDDTLWGGKGADLIYGQGGFNTFLWELDDNWDRIVISADGITDVIYSLDAFDEIIVHGALSQELSFARMSEGIGVFARGVLEAMYLNDGTDLTAFDLSNMTRGELG
ncbi:hypothetical protein OAL13_00660 [bacterium]|nr:hypothetical protein [bacterium]